MYEKREELDLIAHSRFRRTYLLFGTGVTLLGLDRGVSALHSCAATLVFSSSGRFCKCPAMILSLCCAVLLLLFDAMLLPCLLSEVSGRLMEGCEVEITPASRHAPHSASLPARSAPARYLLIGIQKIFAKIIPKSCNLFLIW